jgi:hypothetical protein
MLNRKLYIIQKDNHAYWVSDGDIKKSISMFNLNQQDTMKNDMIPPKHYLTPKCEVIPWDGVVDSLDDIIRAIAEAFSKTDTAPSSIRILANVESLKPLLSHLFFQEMYEPSVALDSSNNINQITMKTEDTYISISMPQINCGTNLTKEDVLGLTTEELLHFEQLKHRATTTFAHPYIKSTYGEGVYEILNHFNRSALARRFCDIPDEELTGLDLRYAYPSMIYKPPTIPVFCEFDRFVESKQQH